jgi:hypothetical protein
MLRSLSLVLAASLLLAPPVAADSGGARDAAVATLLAAAGIQVAETRSECRLKCERLRADCTGSQCRAAYAACISGCR